MAITWRTGGLFAAGLLVGVGVGGWAVIQAHNDAKWQDNGPTHAMGAAPTAQPSPAAPVQASAASAPAPAVVAANACDDSAIVPKAKGDGQESLQSAPTTATASEVSALLLTGKEAAASGRMRDAEVVFLNACRDAQKVQGKDAPMALADSMYQLGRHYATVAQSGTGPKGELLARSQRLYQAALQTYETRYGAKGEKTRFAQQGLATVQRLAGGAPLPSAPAAAAVAQAPAPAPVVKAPAAVAVAKPAPAKVEAAKPAPPAKVEVAKAVPAPAPKPEKVEKPEVPHAAPVAEAKPAPAPAPVKAQAPAPRPQAPVRTARPERDEPPAVASVAPERPRPTPPVASRATGTPPDAAADARPPRATARPSESDRSPAPDLQASVERSRPSAPAPRAAAPVIEVRPAAPAREEVRRAPRSADTGGEETTTLPPGTASGSAGGAPTAEGSAGDGQ